MCHEELVMECFSGTGAYCKDCSRLYNKEYYAKRRRQDDTPESDSRPEGAESEPSDPDPSEPAPRAPDLYIFANSLIPGMVKIGRSNDVERRRVELQRSHLFRLITVATFPGAVRLEANVHAALHAHLVDGPGREWFHVSASGAIHAIAIAHALTARTG